MRHSAAYGRWSSTDDARARLGTGRTRIVLLAVVGLMLAVLSPLVIAGSADHVAPTYYGHVPPAKNLPVYHPATLTAATSNPILAVSVSPSTVIYGQSVTITALYFGSTEVPVAAPPIDFYINGVQLTAAQLTCTVIRPPVFTGAVTPICTTDVAPVGTDTVTLIFQDDPASAASATLVVLTPPSPPPPLPPPPPPPPPPVVTSPTTTPNHGYWLVGSDGGIFTFGDAQFYGSTGNIRLQRPVVGITPTANDAGYWLVASDGGIFSFGSAGFYGSIPGLGIAPAGSGLPHSLNAPIVGMVPSADGGGYFMVGADGGVFTFGNSKFEGSCPGIGGCPGGAAVAVMPDATGNGYWVVSAGGDVQPFGDAAAYGGPGPIGGPVVAAVRSADGNGYYVLFGSGEVFAYGDATYYGGAYGEVGGFNPASTIFTTADNGGYWIVSANGSVITEGDAPYEGGANNLHLNGPIIAGTGW